MSLFDDASLAMIPSAYKDGKLYSIKPTDGSGDFTFTRGSNLAATRVDVNGLIEKGRENLFTYSQDFRDAAGWLVSNATKASITETDPNGGATAANITWTSGSGRYFYKNITSGNVLTTSFYVKSNGSGNKFRLFGDGANDLSQDFTATSEWQRFEFFFERGSGQGVGITNASDNSAADLLVAFAQLEQGLVATDYIETTTTTAQAGILEDMPRLDYSGGASCPSLKLEPQRSNVATHSEYFGAWNTRGTASVSDNQAVSPEGVQNAALLDFGSTTLGANRIDLQPSISAGTDYVFSVFVKNIDANRIGIRNYNSTKDAIASFDFLSGSFTYTNVHIIDTIVESYDNDWYRIGIVCNSGVDTTASMRISPDTNSGSDGEQVYIYGAQLEQGSYPTSYIPTYGTSQTRSADACNTGSLLSTFDDSQGVLFAEFNPSFPEVSSRQITINDATYSNRIVIEVRESGTKIKGLVSAAGSAEFESTKNISVVDTTYKVAVKYSATDTAFFVNGEKVSSSTGTIAMPTGLKHLSFTGRYNDNGLAFESRTKQLAYFPTALTDSECIALTTL